jgi:hypothetical protein
MFGIVLDISSIYEAYRNHILNIPEVRTLVWSPGFSLPLVNGESPLPESLKAALQTHFHPRLSAWRARNSTERVQAWVWSAAMESDGIAAFDRRFLPSHSDSESTKRLSQHLSLRQGPSSNETCAAADKPRPGGSGWRSPAIPRQTAAVFFLSSVRIAAGDDSGAHRTGWKGGRTEAKPRIGNGLKGLEQR